MKKIIQGVWIKNFYIHDFLSDCLLCDIISNLQTELKEAKGKGFTNIRTQLVSSYDGDIRANIVGARLETEEEYTRRLRSKRQRKKAKEQETKQREVEERALYETLKAKFESIEAENNPSR